MSRIKYIIVLLSYDSPSFCHYPELRGDDIMSIDTLEDTITYAYKEDVSLLFILPKERLPESHERILSQSKSVKVASSNSFYKSTSNIIVFHSVDELINETDYIEYAVLNVKPDSVSNLKAITDDVLSHFGRIVISYQGFKSFSVPFAKSVYKSALDSLSRSIINCWQKGEKNQVSVVTDLLFASSHINCNAGIEHITVSPQGQLYICPGFLADDSNDSIGDVKSGVNIINPQLLEFNHAPICKRCDAFQCKRCVWLNRKMTREVNTPSKEQCVVSHIERNCSRELLLRLRDIDNDYLPEKSIPEISYLDPFELFQQ